MTALLVAEHDAALADTMRSALEEDGYSVTVATSPQEARDLFSAPGRDGFCLVLSDSFARPPAPAYAWLDELRTLTTAPVAIVSALAPARYSAWQEQGFAAVLPKPFSLDELTALVESLCGRP